MGSMKCSPKDTRRFMVDGSEEKWILTDKECPYCTNIMVWKDIDAVAVFLCVGCERALNLDGQKPTGFKVDSSRDKQRLKALKQ